MVIARRARQTKRKTVVGKAKKEYSAAEIMAMPKTARPLAFEPLNEKEMATKYADRVRHGKTARDHKRRPREQAGTDE